MTVLGLTGFNSLFRIKVARVKLDQVSIENEGEVKWGGGIGMKEEGVITEQRQHEL